MFGEMSFKHLIFKQHMYIRETYLETQSKVYGGAFLSI